MAGDRFLSALGAGALGGGRLDIDSEVVYGQPGGDLAAHLRRPLGDPGAFGYDGDIHVARFPTGIRKHLRHQLQHGQTRRIAPPCVGIGEVLADVAQAGAAEKGVHDGVQENVGVGVPLQAQPVIEADTAEYEAATRDETVDVVAVAYGQGGPAYAGLAMAD